MSTGQDTKQLLHLVIEEAERWNSHFLNVFHEVEQ